MKIEDLITNASPTVVLAGIFWYTMKIAFAFHVKSLQEQRRDLLDHMKTVCKRP